MRVRLTVKSVVGDQVYFEEKKGRGVWYQGRPGEGKKFRVGDTFDLYRTTKQRRFLRG